MSDTDDLTAGTRRDELYQKAVAEYGPALNRLAQSYERDASRREDLHQNIHLALWTSLARYSGGCSLRTWVYRVAHNVAASHVLSDRRRRARVFVSLDQLEGTLAADVDGEQEVHRNLLLDRVRALLDQLNPADREVMLLYLEGVDSAAIGEITGFSASNVATKIHRIKKLMAHRAHEHAGEANA